MWFRDNIHIFIVISKHFDMNKVAFFPGKYIQGSGAIVDLENIIVNFGNKALILGSPTALKFLPQKYKVGCVSVTVNIEYFNGECCEKELQRIALIVDKTKVNVVVGIGGGKVRDTAKIAADRAKLPVIIFPTITSTDAPCSGCAVTYTEKGVFEKVHYQRLNPAVVLVDLDIIAHSPVRFLVAGMGDALATWFEARSCNKTLSVNECGGLSTLAGNHIARLCYDILLEYGVEAKKENEQGKVGAALSNIAEANILLSGIGFESGGLASAHAIHNGLTVLPETHNYYHGEKVAFGVLAGLHLTKASIEEINTVYSFCISVGLPLTLKDLGINDLSMDNMMKIALKTVEPGSSIHHEGASITPDMVISALVDANHYGTKFS